MASCNLWKWAQSCFLKKVKFVYFSYTLWFEMFVPMEFFSGLWATSQAHNFVCCNMLRINCHIHCCVTISCSIQIRSLTICWWLVSCSYGFKMCILICTIGHYPILCDLRKPLNHLTTQAHYTIWGLDLFKALWAIFLLSISSHEDDKVNHINALHWTCPLWVHDLLCILCIITWSKRQD